MSASVSMVQRHEAYMPFFFKHLFSGISACVWGTIQQSQSYKLVVHLHYIVSLCYCLLQSVMLQQKK